MQSRTVHSLRSCCRNNFAVHPSVTDLTPPLGKTYAAFWQRAEDVLRNGQRAERSKNGEGGGAHHEIRSVKEELADGRDEHELVNSEATPLWLHGRDLHVDRDGIAPTVRALDQYKNHGCHSPGWDWCRA